ncbi:MAG: sodium/proline symporter [Lentimicrobiaceae bacterium]|nr:sodium/proline symporter [Lentimicrobiaceae bacterium]HPG33073.1 sodium/proline symporter [Lentimicrobium sp.]
MNPALVGFIVYLLAMLAIGLITYASNESNHDYFLGGRKMNPWVVALSERTSGESAWLLLGLPGAALAMGIVELWTALGCLLGIFFYWYAIAFRLRRLSESFNAITLPDVFANHFQQGGFIIRFVAMVIIVFFFTFYLAAQFNGAGKVLFVTFGIPPLTGMIIGASVIILYTMLGGFLAVVWTDFAQGILMFVALVILPVAGLVEVYSGGHSLNQALSGFGGHYLSITGGKSGWAAVAVVIGGLSWAFGYMGQPHLLTKFMSIKDPDKLKTSRKIAFIWAVPAFSGAMVIGLAGLALYGQGYFTDVEQVMPHLATSLLPHWIAGILISAAIAAMMSTADSQLLVISSTVSEDFCHHILGLHLSSRVMVRLSRVVTLSVGLVAFLIAITSDKLIFSMVSYAWSGLGASFGPPILLMLWWNKITWKGVLAGMLTGSVSTVVWSEISWLDQLISVRFASFILALAAVVLVSLLTGKKSNLSHA